MKTEIFNGNIKIIVGELPNGGGSMSRTYKDKQDNCSCMRGKMNGELCASIFVKLGSKLILEVRGGANLHTQVKTIESYTGDRIAGALAEQAEAKLLEEGEDFITVLNAAIDGIYSVAFIKGRNSFRKDINQLMTTEYETFLQ